MKENQGKFTVSSKGPSKGKYTIGIDLGGTKVAAALVNTQGKIIGESRRQTVPPWLSSQDPRTLKKKASPTNVKKHIEYVINAMADAAYEVAEPLLRRGAAGRKQLIGIGLASAGPMKIDKGTLDYPSNFKGWKLVPIVSLLQKALKKVGLDCPLHFQNDAIAAALGEGWIGSAKNCSTYAMITVGTGIGTGVIFNGRPAQSGGMGSEWGHMMVRADGIKGSPESYNARSVEGLASGTGLLHRAKERGFRGEQTRDLVAAAREGDELALDLFTDASEALAALFYSLSLGFHPEKFIVSGGMLPARDLFLPQAIEIYQKMMRLKNPLFLAPVQVAKLGTAAGVIGAARLPMLK